MRNKQIEIFLYLYIQIFLVRCFYQDNNKVQNRNKNSIIKQENFNARDQKGLLTFLVTSRKSNKYISP